MRGIRGKFILLKIFFYIIIVNRNNKELIMKEFRMSYRGHTCGWFREYGCLYFAYDARKADYMQYDSRALAGLKKLFKQKVDELEGPKVKGQKYPTEQWSC